MLWRAAAPSGLIASLHLPARPPWPASTEAASIPHTHNPSWRHPHEAAAYLHHPGRRPGLGCRRACAGVSVQARSYRGGLPRRRAAGPACAPAVRQAADRAGPTRGDGLQGRCRWHRGGAGGHESAPGRPHDHAGQHGGDGHQPRAVQPPALRDPEGLCARGAHRHAAAGPAGQPQRAREEPAGVHGLCQVAARPGQLWLGGQWRHQPPGARDVQDGHGPVHGAHPLPGQCARVHRPHGRAGAVHGREHSAGCVVPQARQGARPGRDQQGAQPRAARGAHGDRERHQGL